MGLGAGQQGIEVSLNNSAEGWALLVEPKDYERAQATETIPIGEPGLAMAAAFAGDGPAFHWAVWDGGSYQWLFIIGARPFSESEAPESWTARSAAGAMVAVVHGDTLHENLPHLMANRHDWILPHGPGHGALWSGGGNCWRRSWLDAVGNVAGLLLYLQRTELGASGMVMGALGWSRANRSSSGAITVPADDSLLSRHRGGGDRFSCFWVQS